MPEFYHVLIKQKEKTPKNKRNDTIFIIKKKTPQISQNSVFQKSLVC